MSLRVRAWIVGLAFAAIVLLLILLIYAPPDGRERAELAQFFGRLHPLAVHIPIALLLLVPILECAAQVLFWGSPPRPRFLRHGLDGSSPGAEGMKDRW